MATFESDAITTQQLRTGGSVPPFSQAFGDGAAQMAAQGEAREADNAHRAFTFLVTGLFVGYMILAVIIYLWRGVTFTPDKWAVFLLVGALVLGRLGPFLRDWIPFVLLVFGYEYLRSFAGSLVTHGAAIWRVPRSASPEVHLEGLIAFDKALLHGHMAGNLLQEWVYTPGHVHWYDYFAQVVYSIHFILPCMFAFVLWSTKKERFWQFTLTFCFMTYLAFLFFLYYPAAPPWLANTWGVIHGLQYPQNQVLALIHIKEFGTLDTYSIWGNASPNAVAAFPSLHASFPWLVTLFAIKYYRRLGLVFMLYNVSLWFSVIYLANHWLIDVLAGMAWATISFVVVDYLWTVIVRRARVRLPAPVVAATGLLNAWVLRPVLFVARPVWDLPGNMRHRAGLAIRERWERG